MRVVGCKNINDFVQVVYKYDGTISTYVTQLSTGQLMPYVLTKPCCEKIGGNFDIITQRCYRNKITTGCDYTQPFNLVLNPKGNDGAIFSDVTDETCTLNVEFDYLFKFDCDKLSEFINGNSDSSCDRLDSIFENIGASMSIQKVVPVQLNTITTFVDE